MKAEATGKAGRPKSTNPANKPILVRLTQEQHRQYLEIGGARWLKRLLNDAMAADKTQK